MDNKKEDEFSVAMVIDDYKLKHKEKYWAEGFKKMGKKIPDGYVLDREVQEPGPFKKTTTIIRYYKPGGQ